MFVFDGGRYLMPAEFKVLETGRYIAYGEYVVLYTVIVSFPETCHDTNKHKHETTSVKAIRPVFFFLY